jgi:carotenoid cleavage dioxygenase-like enzyme
MAALAAALPVLFETVRHEIYPPMKLRIVGQAVPSWMAGETLFRNGFGKFEGGGFEEFEFNHLFDTLSLIMRFDFNTTGITATVRLLDSKYYNESLYKVPPYRTLGGITPPMTPEERAETFFHLMHDNRNANILQFGEQIVAVSDIVGGTIINPDTLRFTDHYFKQSITDIITSTHPLKIADRLYNFESNIEPPSYRVYYMNQRETKPERNYILDIPRARLPYMHSFGMTDDKHMILIEFPLFWDVESIITSDTILPTMKWDPINGTGIIVIDTTTGVYRRLRIPEAVFGLHVINSFRRSDGSIVVDFIGYNNSNVMYDFYLAALRNTTVMKCGDLYRLTITDDERVNLSYHKVGMEMPRINPAYMGKDYRFFYGITETGRIGKYDWLSRKVTLVSEPLPEQYASEPVFIARPDGITEDDGMLLSLTLDSADTTSYLGVIDAKKMKIQTKAYLDEPLPLTCHGNFIRKVYA